MQKSIWKLNGYQMILFFNLTKLNYNGLHSYLINWMLFDLFAVWMNQFQTVVIQLIQPAKQRRFFLMSS